MTCSISTETSIKAMSEDGMLVAQTLTNPYDVLAMEEDSVELEKRRKMWK